MDITGQSSFLDLNLPLTSIKRGGGKSDPGYHWKLGGDLPSIGQHSIAKHDIYVRYMGRYISTLTKRYVQSQLKMTVVDGFCGGGRYTIGNGTVEGSPLKLLNAVEAERVRLKARRDDFDLDVDFVFIDENEDHLEFLRDQLKQAGYGHLIGTKIKLVCSTFEAQAPSLIQAIKQKGRAHHALFFLDQYGWSDVKLATIRNIMAELETPEVILTFMVDALVNLLNEKTTSLSALAAIDYTREDVRDLIAMKDNRGWKSLIQHSVYLHIQQQTGASFYTPFFIHPPESHRDYWLLHLSKHHKAREEMGNVFWQANNTMEHFGGPGFNALGFDPSVDLRQQVMDYTFDDDAEARSKSQLLNQLPPMLHDGWRNSGVVTKKDLFASRANDTPVVGHIVDSQLAELRDAGEIVIVGKKKDKRGNVVGKVVRERATEFKWDDEIIRPKQPDLFSVFTKAA